MKDLNKQWKLCVTWSVFNIILLLIVCLCGALSEAGYIKMPLPESEGNTEVWISVAIGVLSSLVASALVTIFTYKKFLSKALHDISAGLMLKMDQSNSELRADQRLLQTTMQGEHEKLRSYLEEAAKKRAALEAQYGQLDSSGKDIVDAVRKLDAFAGSFQLMNARLMELEQQVMSLQQENRQLREHKQEHTVAQEFEY